MKNKLKNIILLLIISLLFGLLLGYSVYTATNSFLELADAQISPLIKVKFSEKETPKETIERVAREEGLNPTLVLMICECESRLQPHFLRVNKNGTIDRGIAAFNSKAYKEVSNDCSFDVECSIRKFAAEAKAGHLKNWYCARNLKLENVEKYLLNKDETKRNKI